MVKNRLARAVFMLSLPIAVLISTVFFEMVFAFLGFTLRFIISLLINIGIVYYLLRFFGISDKLRFFLAFFLPVVSLILILGLGIMQNSN
jgi:hypothetical protein